MTTFVTSRVASLLSSLPTSLIEIVLEYYVSFKTLNYRNDRMEGAGNDPIQGNTGAFAVRMSDGSVTCWGRKNCGGDSSSVQSSLKNVKALCATWGHVWITIEEQGAFAAIVGDEDTVVCWGHKDFGGDCSAVANELKQVEGICGSLGAFAALKRDGTVTTWGNVDYGGDSSLVRGRLKGVKAIYSTRCAFAAVLHDGSVEAWGDKSFGGSIPPEVRARLKQVKCISGNDYAFAALLSDGTVETWGSNECGGNSSRLRASNQLTQVEAICTSSRAFAALRKNGTVICWGGWTGQYDAPSDDGRMSTYGPESTYLEECNQVCRSLDRVVAISSTQWAFAALRSDGSVATWAVTSHTFPSVLPIYSPGSCGFGEDSSSAAGELKEVVAVRGNEGAFAALRQDGTVVTWGYEDSGGDSSAVRPELVGVVALNSNRKAFAARRSDGTVVTWGKKGYRYGEKSTRQLN